MGDISPQNSSKRLVGSVSLVNRSLPFTVPGYNNVAGLEQGSDEAQCRLQLSEQSLDCFICASCCNLE